MRYYRIMSDKETFANFKAANETTELTDLFDGRSLRPENLRGMHFELVKPNDQHPVPEFFDSFTMVCARRIYDSIKTCCGDNVEFFPCTLGNDYRDYYIVNILRSSVKVDYQRSEFLRLPTPANNILVFKHIAFEDEIHEPFFRISELPYSFYFCTESMKTYLDKLDIKGICFSSALFDK